MRLLITVLLIVLAVAAGQNQANAQTVDSSSSEFLNSELARQNYGELQFGIGKNWLLDPLRKYSVGPLTVSLSTASSSAPENQIFINGADGIFLELSPSIVHPLNGWLKFVGGATLYVRQLGESEQHRTELYKDNFTVTSYRINEVGLGVLGGVEMAITSRIFLQAKIGCESTVSGSFERQLDRSSSAGGFETSTLTPVLTQFRLVVAASSGIYLPLPKLRWLRLAASVSYGLTPYFTNPTASTTIDLYRPSILRADLAVSILLPVRL